MYAIGEDPHVISDELGDTDPTLALSIYAQSMKRDDGERARLRTLVNGSAAAAPAAEATELPLAVAKAR